MLRIKTKYSSFTSNYKEIVNDIDRESVARVRRGAAVCARVMRKNANNKGDSTPGGFPAKITGALKKSIGYVVDKVSYVATIGSRSGLIHLIEFGWGDGKTRNKRPLIGPSLAEAEPEAVKVMSQKYW